MKSAVPPKLAYALSRRIQSYTPPDNGRGLRQPLLPSGFKTALKSPFGKSLHTAIPPPAALCAVEKMLTPLFQRFHLLTHILITLRRFVNHFFQIFSARFFRNQIARRIRQPEDRKNSSIFRRRPAGVRALAETVEKVGERLNRVGQIIDRAVQPVNIDRIDLIHRCLQILLARGDEMIDVADHLPHIHLGQL